MDKAPFTTLMEMSTLVILTLISSMELASFSTKMEVATMENGLPIFKKEKESKFGLMARNTKAGFAKEKKTVMVNMFGLMDPSMMDYGKIMPLMARVHIPGLMDVLIMENGQITVWMEKERISGLMDEATTANM